MNKNKAGKVKQGDNNEGRNGQGDKGIPVGYKIIRYGIKCKMFQHGTEPDLFSSQQEVDEGMDQFMKGDDNGQ